VRRLPILIGLAFLVLAPAAHAQRDGEFEIKNEKVEATGTATEGSCDPPEFPLQIDILFGPGNKVQTVQGTDQRTAGTWDPKTGKIETSGGPERYVLEPNGKKGLTGFNYYNDCRWALEFNLNKPGLVFVKPQAAPDAASSPSASPGAAAPTGATGDGKKVGGSAGGLSSLAIAGIVGGGAVAGLIAYTALRNTEKSDAPSLTTMEVGSTATTATVDTIASPADADEHQTKEETEKKSESIEPDLGDEIDPPNARG
jgi:hypothetical protein